MRFSLALCFFISFQPVSLVNVLWKAFQHPVRNVRSSYCEIFVSISRYFSSTKALSHFRSVGYYFSESRTAFNTERERQQRLLGLRLVQPIGPEGDGRLAASLWSYQRAPGRVTERRLSLGSPLACGAVLVSLVRRFEASDRFFCCCCCNPQALSVSSICHLFQGDHVDCAYWLSILLLPDPPPGFTLQLLWSTIERSVHCKRRQILIHEFVQFSICLPFEERCPPCSSELLNNESKWIVIGYFLIFVVARRIVLPSRSSGVSEGVYVRRGVNKLAFCLR